MLPELRNLKRRLTTGLIWAAGLELVSCMGATHPYERTVSESSVPIVQAPIVQKAKALDSLACRFGKQNLLLGFYHDSAVVSIHTKLGVTVNSKSAIEVENEVKSHTDSIYYNLSRIISENSEFETIIIDNLGRWCEVKILLDLIPEFCESELYFEEFVYSNKQTRHLFNKYLTAEGQYWGSISINDSFDLYYRVVDFLSHAKPMERTEFIVNYTSHHCNPR